MADIIKPDFPAKPRLISDNLRPSELFSDMPMLPKAERVRALQYLAEEIARLKAHAASAEHLLALLLQSEGEDIA